jgi:hypothetical protein
MDEETEEGPHRGEQRVEIHKQSGAKGPVPARAQEVQADTVLLGK